MLVVARGWRQDSESRGVTGGRRDDLAGDHLGEQHSTPVVIPATLLRNSVTAQVLLETGDWLGLLPDAELKVSRRPTVRSPPEATGWFSASRAPTTMSLRP